MSVKSLRPFTFGLRTLRASGIELSAEAPLTSITPLVRSQMVISPGTPRETKSTLPESKASFMTSEERKVFHSTLTSPRPAAFACFSTSCKSSMIMNCT